MERNVRKIKRRLLSEGWVLQKSKGKGSHVTFSKRTTSILVPSGKNGELGTGIASSIAKDAGWE